MQHAVEPAINVTITQELRDILAGRIAPPVVADTLPKDGKGPVVAVLAGPIQQADWPYVALRRNGKRPLKFRGMQIVEFSGQINLAGVTCTFLTAIYRDCDDHLIGQLGLDPPEDSPLRPIYLGQNLHESPAFFASVRDILQRVLTEAKFLNPRSGKPDMQDSLARVMADFHNITAGCFREHETLNQRNQTCLQ